MALKDDIKEFYYIYDFGDRWAHHIQVTSFFHAKSDTRLPRLIAGKYAAPPEDIGGESGYEYFLNEILNNPTHPEYENYEHFINNPLWGDFDPKDMKEGIVNILMKGVQRSKAKAA